LARNPHYTNAPDEDQLFYLRQRGLKAEDAVSMIVNGFCKRVFRELPMEFAVEAQKLLGDAEQPEPPPTPHKPVTNDF
jgi:hypothetical protein